jgi:hypothetical protein
VRYLGVDVGKVARLMLDPKNRKRALARAPSRRSEHTNRAPSERPRLLQVVSYFRLSRRIS